MANETYSFWGGGINSKKYLMMQAGAKPTDIPIELPGHSMTNFQNQEIARVTATTVKLQRGQIVEYQLVLRPTRRIGVTFTVQFGSEGDLWTPLLQKVRLGNCRENLYIKALCPSNDDAAHFYAILDTTFDSPTFAQDLISINESTTIVSEQAGAQAPDMVLSFTLGAFVIADVTPPLFAVAFMTTECVDCDTGSYESFVACGGLGGGSDAAYLIQTDDRFNTVNVLTTGVAAGNSFKSLYTDGDTILAGYGDDPDASLAVTGGTVMSVDRGLNFTPGTGIVGSVNGLTFFDGQYIAIGGVGGGGAGKMWVSADGVTWASVTSLALPSATVMTSIAVDPANECFYISGNHGILLKGTKSGGTFQLTAITLPGVSTTNVMRVTVMGPSHVAVGGASGYYAESFDGGDTWVKPAVPTASTIRGIAGLSFVRAALAGGTVISDRTIMTNNAFKAKVVKGGVSITGNFTDLQTLPGEHQYFVGVTDAGEVCMMRPLYPGA